MMICPALHEQDKAFKTCIKRHAKQLMFFWTHQASRPKDDDSELLKGIITSQTV